MRPATVLERAISRAQRGEVAASTVLWTLAASEVIFINEGEFDEGALPTNPLLLEHGQRMLVAVFSHGDLARGHLSEGRVPVGIPGIELLRRLPATAGVVVNPGSRLGFEVPAGGARAFTADLMETTVEL